MKHIRQKFRIFSVTLIVIIGISLYLNLGYINNTNTKTYSYDQKLPSVKTSGTYENITIDALSWNNWTWAENQEWCSGVGSLQNPYIIQGHTLGVETFHDGIKVNNSNDVYFTIRNCTVFWNGSMATGMETGISILNSTKGTIINNTVHGIASGIRIVECEDINIVNNKVYSAMAGIYFTLSDFCEIEGNIVYSTDNGIFLTYSENNILKNNIAYSNEYGVYFTYSYYNEVIGNTVDNNNIGGIKLAFSNFNNITDNDSRGNMDGIHIEDECDNNTVVNNDFSNNNIGLEMYYSDFNTITENIAKNNHYYGIRLEVCENNTVTRNIFKNNTQYGMYVEMGSHNNTISENFFLDNGVHAFDEGLDNDWNSITVGNYWDNHTTPDVSPQDGIVDIPYTYISGLTGSIDYLPIAEDGAPTITIHSPSAGSRFGSTAPSFNVEVIDDYLFETWYSVDGGLYNYTFTENGQIDQPAWNAQPEGSITITFYAIDIAGNEASEDVIINKSIPSNGDDPTIVIVIVVLSLIGGVAVAVVAYIFMKKSRTLE